MNSFHNNEYDINDPQLVAVLDDLPLWSAPFGQKILDIVPMHQNITVLDVGCGAGFPLLELSQRLGATCRCYGIDPWSVAVERAREKIKVWGIHNVDIHQGVAEAIPFENQMFDLIISNNGLNNVDDDIKSVSEISRVCKTGGRFVFTFNLAETFIEFYHVFNDVLLQYNKKEAVKKLQAHIYAKRKPVEYWLDILKEHGFAVENTFYEKFYFRYADGTSLLNHFFIKLAFLPSWREIVKDDAEILLRQIENQLNNIGELKLSVLWVAIDAVKS
jgi:ubiquinone/menaquinone biosynthesis C-methylase UbiE